MIVLVSSCDRYRDCWEPFKHSFHKYWPDCPWPIYVITNELDAPIGTSIKVGKTQSWAHSMDKALDILKEKTAFLILEDMWLVQPIDTKTIQQFASYVENGIFEHIRLTPSDEALEYFSMDRRLKILKDNAVYKTSLQPCICNLNMLKEVIFPIHGYHDDNPYYWTSWAFESEGSLRFKRKTTKKFAATEFHQYIHLVDRWDPYGDWVENPVVSGEWTAAVQQYSERENIKIDTSIHPKDR